VLAGGRAAGSAASRDKEAADDNQLCGQSAPQGPCHTMTARQQSAKRDPRWRRRGPQIALYRGQPGPRCDQTVASSPAQGSPYGTPRPHSDGCGTGRPQRFRPGARSGREGRVADCDPLVGRAHLSPVLVLVRCELPRRSLFRADARARALIQPDLSASSIFDEYALDRRVPCGPVRSLLRPAPSG